MAIVVRMPISGQTPDVRRSDLVKRTRRLPCRYRRHRRLALRDRRSKRQGDDRLQRRIADGGGLFLTLFRPIPIFPPDPGDPVFGGLRPFRFAGNLSEDESA